MTDNKLTEGNFNLNLLFKGNKKPTEAFNELKEAFQSLSSLDELLISSIDTNLQIEYSLQSLEYSSIKTTIAQIIRGIPDDAIKDLDWKKLVGHYLLKLKYIVLNYLEKNPNVDSKDSIEVLIKLIENEKSKTLKNPRYIITEINSFQLITVIEPIILVLSQLKNEDKIEYKSIDGSALLNNKITFNKAKILWELGDKKFENETTEVLKIKKLDLLNSNSNWSFRLGNKSLEAKISDKQWLDKYHAREYPLLPEDSLKVKLKVIYTSKTNGKIVKASYEITKVISVIYPEDNQNSIF